MILLLLRAADDEAAFAAVPHQQREPSNKKTRMLCFEAKEQKQEQLSELTGAHELACG